jgi:catechol 2,3-dioxygenase-like lactoylglutathione lyase family enzyme
MFDHVAIRVSDRAASERFYETVLSTLGIQKTSSGATLARWEDFLVVAAGDDKPVTRGLHIGFAAPSQAHADEFWRVGTEAGYGDDGAPGPRPEYGDDYYGAFLLDPDGNSAEGARHDNLRRGGVVDHLWIRVADLARSREFYAAVAPHAGFRLKTDTPERAQFSGGNGSFSILPGEPTEDLHMAFSVADNSTVDAFHATLVAAGVEDNGGPGERPRYHPGYYAAFVLDPDGNNIEILNHNRG